MVVTVIKLDELGNINVDGIDTTTKEQNDKYLDHPTVKEYREFYDYFWSRPKPNEKGPNGEEVFFSGDEYVREIAKLKKVNLNLWSTINQRLHDNKAQVSEWKCNKGNLWEEDSEERMKELIEKKEKDFNENHLSWIETMINDMKQFKQQLEDTGNTYEDTGNDYNDPNKDKSREELERRAAEIEAYRNKVKGEIEKVLNEEPKITSAELDSKCQNWQEQIWNTIIATGEKEIDEIKEKVLTNISIKRTAKKSEGSEQSEWDKLVDETKVGALEKIIAALQSARLVASDLSPDCQNWREQINQAATEGSATQIEDIQTKLLADIKNKKELKVKKGEEEKDSAKLSAQKIVQHTAEEINEMKDNELEEAMKLFVRWEGENEFKNTEITSQIEERLIKNSPELYRETIIKALQERMSYYGISMNELDEETRKVIRGEITDVDKVKEIKEGAIKKIGSEGSKKQWTSWMSQAQALFSKVKENVTEQAKNDLKAIQKQIKKLKSGTNSYLTAFYQGNKPKIDKLEKDLASFSSSNQTGSPGKTPWGIIIPLSLVAVALVAIVAVVVVRKRKQVKR